MHTHLDTHRLLRNTLLILVLGCSLGCTPGWAQCVNWKPGECPDLGDLALVDEDNSPVSVAPGHTLEDICPPEVNSNKEMQLDITEYFVDSDETGLLYMRCFYNNNSAASTTVQYWFFDTDLNSATGGGDAVRPDYVNVGRKDRRGPAPCSLPHCDTQFLEEHHASGFEYYIQSYGSGALDFAIFMWVGGAWEELAQPFGTINVQGSEDNPYNPYIGNNGFRGIAYLPLTTLGLNRDSIFGMYGRSWACIDCCGDGSGGEGIVYPEGMDPCVSARCGDCDGDGFVTILDAYAAAQHDAGQTTLTETGFSNCNVVGEYQPSRTATVSVLDALQIVQYVVGRVSLTCCTP